MAMPAIIVTDQSTYISWQWHNIMLCLKYFEKFSSETSTRECKRDQVNSHMGGNNSKHMFHISLKNRKIKIYLVVVFLLPFDLLTFCSFDLFPLPAVKTRHNQI